VVECEWCKYNKNGCGIIEQCDFRTLPYERDVIVQRIGDELKAVDDFKQEMVGGEVSDHKIRIVVDKLAGVEIMISRLVADFGMSREQVMDVVGFKPEKISFFQRIKLLAKLNEMKANRGKHRGG
jgi:hypothetical protein